MESVERTGCKQVWVKMLHPVHRDIKVIITEKYQRHSSIKALAMEMDITLVDFSSTCLLV